MARKALIHKNTNQTTNNGGVISPKLPAVGTLQKGEIAINYKNGYETLSIENDAGEVIPFASWEQVLAYIDVSQIEIVHKSETETITGDKTFTGTVSLGSNATATTLATTDNDTSVATTAFVHNAITSGTSNKTASIPYGEVNSTSTSTTYTATVNGITELRDGVCMLLKNGVVTSVSGFTININGLGAKPCYSNMATGNDVTPTNPTRETTIFNINYTMLFVYSSTIVDGGGWICYRGYDANTNTIGYQIRRNNGTYNAFQAVSQYKILFSYSPTQMLAPTTSTGTGTSKTVTTYDFDPFGAIFVYTASATVANGSAIAIASMWEQYTVDLRYSFNCGTITNNKDVYVKCSPQSNGRVKFAGTNPIVQALPTTEDGYVYIYLGHMYSTSSIVLALHHPVYYYKNSAIREWTNTEPVPTTVAQLSDASTYANKIESISVNGVAQTITNKNVDITIEVPEGELSENYAISELENENLTLATGDTFETAFSKIEKAIIDNEKTVAGALNDLNERLLDINIPTSVSDLTDDIGIVKSVTVNGNTGNVRSTAVTTIVTLTEAQYEALSTKDSSTLYIITSS